MYIKIAAGLVRLFPPKFKCRLSCKTSPRTQHYNHDLGKFRQKYLNSFKAAALSTKYKKCLTNSYQKNLIPTCLCSCDIEKLT